MKSSVLVIDDNDIDQYLIKRQLTESGFTKQVFNSANGEEAIVFLSDYDNNKAEYKNEFPPGLILLDINMPLMDGFEFLKVFKKLRQERDYCATPVVVFLTSSNNQADVDKAMDFDFVKGYLHKPLDIDQLKKIVSN
ncbi:MAG: response regulator [Gammaproteobacteria bacterium]|nr:response regulator [Gammaproteobacteria bacterium]